VFKLKTELQKQLFEKYPKIFRQRSLPMTETCMCWGIDTGDGWYHILDALCGNIQAHVDWSRKQMAHYLKMQRIVKRVIRAGKVQEYANETWGDREYHADNKKKFLEMPLRFYQKPTLIEQVEAVQVKEKFGSLRFYTNGNDDYVDGLIRMAESMSAVTCETCGKPGKISGKGYISCKCPECTKDENFGKEVL
jgi:hypothetical protein